MEHEMVMTRGTNSEMLHATEDAIEVAIEDDSGNHHPSHGELRFDSRCIAFERRLQIHSGAVGGVLQPHFSHVPLACRRPKCRHAHAEHYPNTLHLVNYEQWC